MDETEPLFDAVEPPVDAIHTRGMGGQFDMDMREISLDRAHPTDELVELTFNALQTSTHIAQEREHETVGWSVMIRAKQIGREDDTVKCGCRRIPPDLVGGLGRIRHEPTRNRGASACENDTSQVLSRAFSRPERKYPVMAFIADLLSLIKPSPTNAAQGKLLEMKAARK